MVLRHSLPSHRAARRIAVAGCRIPQQLSRRLPLRDPGPLAEPWRRLAAAVLDMLLLFPISLAIVARNFNTLNAPSSDGPLTLGFGMAVIAWSYVLAGWALGATPGMRLLGIRLETLEGNPRKRPGLVVALRRIAGYWLACLPAKGGLWPILTHPLRQGWHDRIAGTIVVKRVCDGSELRELADRIEASRIGHPRCLVGEHFPAPDLRLAFKGSGWVLALCIVIVIAATYPVAWTLRSRLAGAPGDSAIFYWAYWFTGFMLRHHQPLTHTRYLFYPQDVSLVYSTMDWFNGFLAAALSHWFSLIAVYNVLWLGSLATSMFTGYLLIAAVTGSRSAAFAVSPAFGLSPYFLAHGLGHANLVSAEFLPLIALFAYACLTLRQMRYAVLAGVAWALAGWCDLQFLLFGALIVGSLTVAYWWNPAAAQHGRSTRLLREHSRLLAVMTGCAALGMAWLFAPSLRAHVQERSGSTDRIA